MKWPLLVDLIFMVLIGTVSFGLGAKYEENKPKPTPEPVIHHHMYYLDRSECKKPV